MSGITITANIGFKFEAVVPLGLEAYLEWIKFARA